MTNINMKKVIPAVLSISMVFAPLSAFAGTEDYGHIGAASDSDFTLEEMLKYAIEDEYLAKAEYEKIMSQFDVTRPFSNIMKAETQHISALLPLFEKYGVTVPDNTASEHLVIPKTLAEIYSIGVEAEVANIAMYEKFLADPNLPEDVKAVFTALMKGSENHLKAFERGDERASSGVATGAAQARNGSGFKGGNGVNGDSEARRGSGNANGVSDGTASGTGAGMGAGVGAGAAGSQKGNGFRATGVRNGLGSGLQDGSCLE
ncbi:ferritin-like domain-containing protein [Acidaminobacter hydrogenoformans]|uniref:DUF2202 domain-containing protein n=1 Tax=Acidaminobacter hydrogenoformans DSM 2784 TaxID=1120920 RepID=A0A1G5S8B7_9FIRM|nr:DUF2202 domain-containing protein [Acidaminobacter hydrogenoformans]SCZ81849.1 hypothetical protein SAMN03080599_03094 [Acidaminobacter hydrogenoformans DSM 2784]